MTSSLKTSASNLPKKKTALETLEMIKKKARQETFFYVINPLCIRIEH